MTIAADYPLLDVIWTMIVFFGFVIWLWILFAIFVDIFRRHELSGWGKAGWTVLIVFLPLLGVLIYLIADGKGMAERRAQDIQASQHQFDQHIRTVAGGPASQIREAKELLDSGAITQAEFDQIKSSALSGQGGGVPAAPGCYKCGRILGPAEYPRLLLCELLFRQHALVLQLGQLLELGVGIAARRGGGLLRRCLLCRRVGVAHALDGRVLGALVGPLPGLAPAHAVRDGGCGPGHDGGTSHAAQ
jgi:hypothetical protein